MAEVTVAVCEFCGHAESKHNSNGCLERPYGDKVCDCWGEAGSRNTYRAKQAAGWRANRTNHMTPATQPRPTPTPAPAPAPAPVCSTQPLAVLAEAIRLIVHNAYEFGPTLRGALLEYD